MCAKRRVPCLTVGAQLGWQRSETGRSAYDRKKAASSDTTRLQPVDGEPLVRRGSKARNRVTSPTSRDQRWEAWAKTRDRILYLRLDEGPKRG